MVVERDVAIAMPDGTHLVGDIFRPARPGRYPVILGCHPYNNELQTAPIRPIGYGPHRGFLEAGDPEFFVRRGYVHAIFNVRGTGKSQGLYQRMGPQEVADVAHLIGVLANMPWSSGRVGMFGGFLLRLASGSGGGPASGGTGLHLRPFWGHRLLSRRLLPRRNRKSPVFGALAAPRRQSAAVDWTRAQGYLQALAELQDDGDLMGWRRLPEPSPTPRCPATSSCWAWAQAPARKRSLRT